MRKRVHSFLFISAAALSGIAAPAAPQAQADATRGVPPASPAAPAPATSPAAGVSPPATADSHGGSPSAAAAAAAAAVEERKTALKTLDFQLATFDALIEKIPDVQQRASMKALSDGFKDRRSALEAAYVHDTYSDLRWEIDVEYQRLVFWFTAPTVTLSEAKAGHEPVAAIDLLHPDPSNRAERQAALDVLTLETQQREDRADEMPAGPARDAELRRIRAIKEMGLGLAQDFTQARWDAVVAAMQETGGANRL